MGQTFSGMTNPGTALINPNTGDTESIGNPRQILAQSQTALQNAFQPNFADVTAPNNAQLPQIGRPSFQQAAQYGAFPGGTNAMSPALSKAGKLMLMLSNGLQGALAGHAAEEQMTAQSGGRRSGGAGVGFEAAYALPWQRAQQAQQVELGQAGLQPVETPFGTLPAELATRTLLPWMARGQAMENVANIGAGAKTNAAQIGATAGLQRQQLANQGRMDAAALTAALAANKGAKYIPDTDAETGAMFYHVLNPYGKEIGQADVNMIPGLMARTSSTVDYQQDANGNIVALPKTTTTAPVIPGRGTPAAAAATGGGVNARPVNENGQPMQGKGSAKENASWVYWQDSSGRTVAGPLSMARQNGAQNPAAVPTEEVRSITDARQAVNLIDKQGTANKPNTWGIQQLISSLDKDGDLGVAASRMNSWLAGGVGAAPGDDPRIMALLDKSQLAMTLVMKAHFGASGGRSPQMLEHFLSMANAKTMNAATLRSGFAAVDDYMTDRAMIPGQANAPANGGKRPPLSSFER